MNREFLDLYNRELQLLSEQAREFAEEYPGIAERLGGIVEDRTDPMVARAAGGRGLPRGARAAQAQARVSGVHQQSARAIGPALSCADALGDDRPGRAATFGDKSLHEGHAIPRGSYLDASFRERDRQIACRYRLSSDITVWPFEISGAEYFSSPGAARRAGVAGREPRFLRECG